MSLNFFIILPRKKAGYMFYTSISIKVRSANFQKITIQFSMKYLGCGFWRWKSALLSKTGVFGINWSVKISGQYGTTPRALILDWFPNLGLRYSAVRSHFNRIVWYKIWSTSSAGEFMFQTILCGMQSEGAIWESKIRAPVQDWGIGRYGTAPAWLILRNLRSHLSLMQSHPFNEQLEVSFQFVETLWHLVHPKI